MIISIEIKENENFIDVIINGEIDAYTAPKLRESLFPLSEKKEIEMVMNLSGVSYLDSTGLGVFVGVFKNLRSNNSELKLVGLSARLLKLFEITGLANIIDIRSKIEGEAK